MNRIAYVYFSPDENYQMLKFWRAMNGAGIIMMSNMEINRFYQEEVLYHGTMGHEISIILHNDEEEKRFGLVMKTFFGKKDYDIVDDTRSKHTLE